MHCAIENLTPTPDGSRPRITAIELETKEIQLSISPSAVVPGASADAGRSPSSQEAAKSDVTRKPVITPTHGVKNTNFLIEEAIDSFHFLFSEAAPRCKIHFSENQTIVFDGEEKVDGLITSRSRDDDVTVLDGLPSKPVLKNRSECVDVSYFEHNENSYLEENDDDGGFETCTTGQHQRTVEDTWVAVERLFTLHDIPLSEARNRGDLLMALQRLAIGAAESFRKKEQCYKFVGRRQSIEEIDELEYFNDNLKCDVDKLNKRLANESIKWEVVDQTIVENDELKAKVGKLETANKTLTAELEFSPKWEDVDGLLEEDKELKSAITELTTKIEDDASRHGRELQDSMFLLDGLKGQNAQLLLNEAELTASNSKLAADLIDASTRLEQLKSENGKLKSANSHMNGKMRSMKRKVYNRFFAENIGLAAANEDLTQKLKETCTKLEQALSDKKELSSTHADLISANSRLLCERDDLMGRLESITTRAEDLQSTHLQVKSDMEFIEKFSGSKIKQLTEGVDRLEAKRRGLELLHEQDTLKIAHLAQMNNDLTADKDSVLGVLDQKLAEINLLKIQLKDNESLIADAKQWKIQEELCLSSLGNLQDENFKLLEKYTKLEVICSKLESENNELSSFKDDFRAFDEKYDWLESIALSLRQEKENSDSQVKQLRRQLRASTKAIESLERTKGQNRKKPQELQNRLDGLQSKYDLMVEKFNVKENELQQALENMQELEVALRDIMSQSRTCNPVGEEAASDEDQVAPSKRWRLRSPSSFRSKRGFFPRSVAS